SYPFELSGGMQQRVALLRAVMAGARTLILDEPFGALDTVTRHRLQDWLAEVIDQLACSVIFVTHDLEEAVVLSHRVLVLSERPASILGHLKSELSSQDRVDRMSSKFLHTRSALVDLIVSKESHE
ncbi:ABC transporter ATP-binding protein, partial [Candidatus Bipolaricaulota bacterium]|nr:ABC transporter ATP-binding protein [Candidatus Bipolaricaulota bacterium]